MSTETNLPGHFTYRITNFIRQFAHRRWGTVPSPAVEVWEQEIYLLEQNLADEATRPSRINRRNTSLEPLTEQQRIIDLAG